MSKKIIALALATMLLVLSFSACGKKKENIITAPGGKEYEAVTDENGKQIIDGDDIRVYKTDENGEYVTDAEGNKETVLIEYPKQIVNDKDKIYETKDIRFTIQDNAWLLATDGVFIMKDKEGSVKAMVKDIDSVGENFIGIKAYVDKEINNDINLQLFEELDKQGYTVEIHQEDVELTSKMIQGIAVEYQVKDPEGKMFHYAYNIYFLYNARIFRAEYSCLNGAFYDETVNPYTLFNTGLTFK